MTATLVVAVSMLALTWSNAEAVTGPINVKALPAGCPTNATGTGAITDFNGNTIPDDTDALVCALTLVPSQGVEIYIPAGTYIVTSKLSVTNKPLSFRGEGQGATTLVFYGPSTFNGIEFISTSTTTNYPLSIRSLSILRTQTNGAAAIFAQWPTPASRASFGGVTTTIHDVHISVTDYSLPSQCACNWTWGIVLDNAVNAKLDAFNLHFGWSATAGIEIRGKSLDVTIGDGDISAAVDGILVKDQSEGVHVRDVESGGTWRAFRFISTGGAHSVANCHALASESGIQAYSPDMTIANNLIYMTEAAHSAINYGIEVQGFNARITGNLTAYIGASHATIANGIVVHGTSTNAVAMGNITANMDQGMIVGGATNWVVFVGNNNRPVSGGVAIVNLGGANFNQANNF
jgi:hypothetical protein